MTALHRAIEHRGNVRRARNLKAYWEAVHRIMDREHCSTHIARWLYQCDDTIRRDATKVSR